MYNTTFQVKYHDIELALLAKLQKMMEKKLAIASGMYMEELHEQEREKERKQKVAAEKQPLTVPTCLNCAACTCSKKGNKVKEPKVKEPKVKEPKVKKETKKEQKAREEAEKVAAAEKALKEAADAAAEAKAAEEKKQLVEEDKLNGSDDEDEEDLEYTLEDVHIICDKLYRDELLSVFNVTSTEDENMDAGIKSAIEHMINNQSFRQLLDDIKGNLVDFQNFSGTPDELENMKRNTEYLIFITLFSQKLFYLTHICLCQLFTVGEIDPELLLKIKDKTIDLFKS
jgi:hypothetical protein